MNCYSRYPVRSPLEVAAYRSLQRHPLSIFDCNTLSSFRIDGNRSTALNCVLSLWWWCFRLSSIRSKPSPQSSYLCIEIISALLKDGTSVYARCSYTRSAPFCNCCTSCRFNLIPVFLKLCITLVTI